MSFDAHDGHLVVHLLTLTLTSFDSLHLPVLLFLSFFVPVVVCDLFASLLTRFVNQYALIVAILVFNTWSLSTISNNVSIASAACLDQDDAYLSK